MNHLNGKLVAALLCAGILVLASCNSEPKPESSNLSGTGTSKVTVEPGEAGGTAENTFTANATVTSIDTANRKLTLTSEDGVGKATFTCGSAVRNFDQIRVGDKVSATITERLVVFVRSGSSDPRISHAAGLATAPKGAKPGAIVAESYEITATVKSIDSVTRTATLQFPNDQVRTVKVRPDVDLNRYSAGDTVVIRVTAALTVLVEEPK